MLLISCPNCGSRDETEFHYGGQAHVAYPENPTELNDREWAEFLFYRDNTKGAFAERWLHSTGCRQWFNMLRDTVTYDIQAVYPMGTPRPTASSTSPDALSVVVPIGARKQPQLIEQRASATSTASSTTAPEGATK
ncbi:sarcosine oxidase subunit delta family protein [Pseudarthrobacter psychrotolerans]|uniref:Sarcosine oxidase subunit delta family protein n=1 Tax=Pseudarthrobacter psychrotolerans TaxID=2697569 RepID=A0A6P1NKD8_9MICC|nr:sarcosine oxidase subunit delta [Pseudarthrobacter psychrotolerans]QHK20846.1 sarcosine oxidase subunit delta family protein [Pseudarthrobacter psychrotolerans]